MSTENHLVFVPLPIMSHLVPSVETAKLLIEHDQSLSITVILLRKHDDTKIDDTIKHSIDSRVNFVEIYENPQLVLEQMKSPNTFLQRFTEGLKDRVKEKVEQLMKNNRVRGLVIDMFCTCMIDVANELGIPTFLFPVSGAASLGLFFHLQTLRDNGEDNFKTLINGEDAELHVQTYVHHVPVKVLPFSILKSDGAFLSLPRRFRETKGILINTFLAFEPHALQALTSDEEIPPVYAIGPILQPQSTEKKENHDEIIEWLNGQPDSSVVFLCFGSLFCFEANQVKEIALALERSEQRFLWSLRKSPPKEKVQLAGEYDNFDEVLPKGFSERTAGIGKVIGWAPQLAILSHRATGGFVSHCGWLSTLESIWCGVPIATWPLAADHQLIAFFLVKELGMAVDVQMEYMMNSGVIVTAQKIESAIKQLMDPQNGIRDKLKVMKNKSRMAFVSSKFGSLYKRHQTIIIRYSLFVLHTKKRPNYVLHSHQPLV